MDINEQKFYEQGDKTGFAKLQYTGEAVGIQTPEMTEEKLATFDVTSTFAQTRVLMDTDPVTAIERLSEPEFRKGLSGPQIGQADKLIRYAESAQRRLIAKSNEGFDNRKGVETERLAKLLTDGELIEQEIDEVDLQAFGAQKEDEFEWKQNWKKILRATMTRSEPLISNNDAYDSLSVGSELVERGTKSPAEWETEFAEANAAGQLTQEDRRNLRSKDIIATKTMQNRTFSDAKAGVLRPRLVEIRQGELAGLVEAQEFALKSKDFKVADALNFNIKKAQVQEWNYGRSYMELRSQIAQNPEWSQKQIFVAGDIIADDFDKNLSDLMKEFDGANPQQAILSSPPDDAFKEIWKDLSQDDRAKIWEARLAGASVREILGELPK